VLTNITADLSQSYSEWQVQTLMHGQNILLLAGHSREKDLYLWDGATLRQLNTESDNYGFSQPSGDGRILILAQKANEVWLLDRTSLSKTPLPQGVTSYYTYITEARWSPDGQSKDGVLFTTDSGIYMLRGSALYTLPVEFTEYGWYDQDTAYLVTIDGSGTYRLSLWDGTTVTPIAQRYFGYQQGGHLCIVLDGGG
jgi:Tol biopolymer transport system component